MDAARYSIGPAHLILALCRIHMANSAAEPGEFFKTAESHYSDALPVDASRHTSAGSASNAPDSALNRKTIASEALCSALSSVLYSLTVVFTIPLMVP